MNSVTVIIEQLWGETDDSAKNEQRRVEVSMTFAGPDFTSTSVLTVFEDALRGAGFDCPHESLSIERGAP